MGRLFLGEVFYPSLFLTRTLTFTGSIFGGRPRLSIPVNLRILHALSQPYKVYLPQRSQANKLMVEHIQHQRYLPYPESVANNTPPAFIQNQGLTGIYLCSNRNITFSWYFFLIYTTNFKKVIPYFTRQIP